MYKIGLSSCGRLIEEKDFIEYQESGINAIEVSVGLDHCNNIDFKRLLELSKKYEIDLWSFHLPFSPFSKLEISEKELADGTVAYFGELIQKASDVGIDKFVVHPSGEPIGAENRAERMKVSKESLFELAKIARRNGAVIAVEVLPRTCLGNCSDEILELISVDSALKVCFDTNHLLGEDQIEFIRKVGNKITTLHVSDYDFVNERHWLPGEGKTNWNAVYKALNEVGYNGAWLYEVGFGSTKTITRERDLNCKDFVINANEIFEGRQLTVVPHQKLLL